MHFTRFLIPHLIPMLYVFSTLLLTPFSRAKDSEPEEEELIQEFFVAETAVVQEKGEMQLTLGVKHDKEAGTKSWETALTFEFGITDHLQVAASTSYLSQKSSGSEKVSGLGDISLEIAYGILTDMDKLVLTMGMEAVFPEENGSGSETEENEEEWEPFAIIARQMGAGQVHFGAGMSLEEKELEVHLAGVYPWKNWRGTLEFNGSFQDENDEITITPGLTWVSSGVEVGAGLSLGQTSHVPDNRIIVQLTLEF